MNKEMEIKGMKYEGWGMGFSFCLRTLVMSMVCCLAASGAWATNTYSSGTVTVDTSANTPYAFTADDWPVSGDITVDLSAAFNIESTTYSYDVFTVPNSISGLTADGIKERLVRGTNAKATVNDAIDGIEFFVSEDAENSVFKASIKRKEYVYFTKSTGSSTDNYWTTAASWNPSGAPEAGKDYIVYGKRRLQHGASGNNNATFNGDSLTIMGGYDGGTSDSGWGYNLANKGLAYTFKKLVLGDWGFAIWGAAGNSPTQDVKGEISVVASDEKPAVMGASSNSRTCWLSGDLTGNGTLMIAPFDDTSPNVHIKGNNRNFMGKWCFRYNLKKSDYSGSSIVIPTIYSNYALGGNPTAFTEKAVCFNGGTLKVSANVDMTALPNRGFYYENNSTITVDTGKTLKLGTTITTADGITITKNSNGTLDLGASTLASGTLTTSGGTTKLGSGFTAASGTRIHFGSSGVLAVPADTTGNGIVLGGRLTATSTLAVDIPNASQPGTYVLFSVKSAEITAANITVTGNNGIFASTSVDTQTVTIGETEYTKYTATLGYADAENLYVWTGEANDGLWTTKENWKVNDSTPDSAPSANADKVFIPASEVATLTITGSSSSDNLGTLVLGRDVTLTGKFKVNTIKGDYTLTADNLSVYSGSDYIIYCNLVVKNTFNNSSTSMINIYGDVSGDKDSVISNNHESGTSYNGVHFYGNCSNFKGTYYGGSRYSQDRDYSLFESGAATSEDAFWSFGSYGSTKMFYTDGDTYKFGRYVTRGSFNINGAKNVTVEIGALDDEPSSLTSGEFGSGNGNKLRKVGSEKLTLNASNIAQLIMAGGSVSLSGSNTPASLALEADGTEIDLSCEANATMFTNMTGNAHSLTVNIAETISVTTSGTFDGVTDFTKIGNGDLVLTNVPKWTGTISVTGGSLILPAGTDATVDSETCYIDSSVTDSIVIRNLDGSYVWTGLGSDNNLETPGNWLCDNKAVESVPLAGGEMVVLFPANDGGWTVNLPAGDTFISGLTINAAVSFTGTGRIRSKTFEGSGSIILDGTTGIGLNGQNVTCPLPVKINGENTFHSHNDTFTYSGNLSGSGILDLTAYSRNGAVRLTGDNSEFSGTLYATNKYKLFITSATAGSANAKWYIDAAEYDNNKGENTVVGVDVQFGEFHGKARRQLYSNRSGCGTYVIGSLNTDSDITGYLAAVGGAYAERSDYIRKVGSGTLTSTVQKARGYYIDDGTLYLSVEPNMYYSGNITFRGGVLQLADAVTTDLSARISGSTAAIKVNIDEDATIEWGTALSGNVAEVDQSGKGTLKLTTAPSWDSTKFTVSAQGGALFFPATYTTYTLGDNTEVDATWTEGAEGYDANYTKLIHFTTTSYGGNNYDSIADAMIAVAEALAEDPTASTEITITRTTNEAITSDAGERLSLSLDVDVILDLSAASNTTLVKSGAGTLTLSVAPLAETFEISVEAGKVVVPKTATNTKPAKGTKCEEVGETLEYTKGPDIENGTTTNVEGLADQDVADAVAATYNVTLTDAQVTQGLETSYYKVIATSTATLGTYTISAVLNEEEVKVEFGDDEEEPVAFTDEKPTFKLKEGVKKGLYYSVGTITDPTVANPTITIAAEQQATADGQEISLAVPTFSFGEGNVLYYKLSVSDTAQTTP